MLSRHKNEDTGKIEYCLMSSDGKKVLEYFGEKKPSEARVEAAEKRVNYFKHGGKTWEEGGSKASKFHK